MTNTNKKSKNTRKLLGAIGMLSVSAAMLVSSTFAWFSMNKNVTAQTMTIAAKSADPIIEISANGTDFYNNLRTVADANTEKNWTLPDTTGVKLKLVTPSAISNAGAVSWGWAASSNHANAEVGNTLTAKSLTAQTTPAKTESNRAAYFGDGTDLYVLTQKLTIRNVSADVDAKNLVIKNVTINKGNNTIGDSARVLFVNAAGEYALYKPGATTATIVTDHQWLDPASGTAPAADMNQTSANLPIIISQLNAKGTTANTFAAGSSTDVDVYVFFDGTDSSAYTDNATDLSDVTVNFEFGID